MTNVNPSFDPSASKKIYTAQEWEIKENWYVQKLSSLQLPLVSNTGDIRNYIHDLDRILTTARLDLSFVKQNYETYDTILKNMEKTMFSDIKLHPPVELQSIKLTVDEAKGYVTSFIGKQEYQQTGVSLYEIVKSSNQRNIFMDGVVKNLMDKKESVITHMTLNKQDLIGGGAGVGGQDTNVGM